MISLRAMPIARRGFSLARAEGQHALMRDQRPVDLAANVLKFVYTSNPYRLMLARPHGLSYKTEARVLAVASRTVRVAATYLDERGQLVPQLTMAGTGLVVGSAVLTAAHIAPQTATLGSWVGKLAKLYVTDELSAPLPFFQSLMSWFEARYDYPIASMMAEMEERVSTWDINGTAWAAGSDVAVLRLGDADARYLARRARRTSSEPLQFAGTGTLHQPASQAQINHFVVGYPSVPEAEDEAAALWHGTGHITNDQLRAMMPQETRLLSCGTQLWSLPSVTSAGLAAEALVGSSQGGDDTPSAAKQHYTLRPHWANCMSGMSGSPVMDLEGRIVGMHVGGRSDGSYNMYVGVDHPVMAAAFRAILKPSKAKSADMAANGSMA